MSSIACRVCLRTDVPTQDLPEQLKKFHEELCEFEIVRHKRLKHCAACVHQMKKFYKFKGQCIRADGLLKLWIKQKKKDISEYRKELPTPSLQITNNSSSFLFECQHGDDTLYDTNVSTDCNRNLLLKLEKPLHATGDRMYPIYPVVNPVFTPNISIKRPVDAGNPILTIDPNVLFNQSKSTTDPGLKLSIQPVPSGHKPSNQADLTFDPDFDVAYETDPLSVKIESEMDIDDQTVDIIGKESVVKIVNYEDDDATDVDDTTDGDDNTDVDDTTDVDDATDIDNAIEVELKEVDNVEDTINYTISDKDRLDDGDSMDSSTDDQEEFKNSVNNTDTEIDSDEYTYEYLEDDIDFLKFKTETKRKKSSEVTCIEKKQADKKLVKESVAKIKAVSNNNSNSAPNKAHLPLEANIGKRITGRYEKKEKATQNLQETYRLANFKAVPSFKGPAQAAQKSNSRRSGVP